MNKIWRPWVDLPEENKRETRQQNTAYGQQITVGNIQQNPQFKHPVRLLWTKAVYDYMYATGETLLRNFPVQATIQVVDWNSDSSDEEDEDEFEYEELDSAKTCKRCREQGNKKKCAQCKDRENTNKFQ